MVVGKVEITLVCFPYSNEDHICMIPYAIVMTPTWEINFFMNDLAATSLTTKMTRERQRNSLSRFLRNKAYMLHKNFLTDIIKPISSTKKKPNFANHRSKCRLGKKLTTQGGKTDISHYCYTFSTSETFLYYTILSDSRRTVLGGGGKEVAVTSRVTKVTRPAPPRIETT